MADTDVGWAHAAAIKNMVEAAVTGWTVYLDEEIPDTAVRYLKVWPPPGERPTITLNGYGGDARTRTQITAAALTEREVITALDRAGAALHRRRPSITGRVCGLITQVPEIPAPPAPEKDPNVRTQDGHPIFFSFLQFTLFSSPAPEEP